MAVGLGTCNFLRGAAGETRTLTSFRILAPKASVSANFTTAANNINIAQLLKYCKLYKQPLKYYL